MITEQTIAPGWPGIPAKWTSGAKSGVGTAFNSNSSVWFTISHGILNEIYFPKTDQACTRDMELIITDGHSFFSEEKRNTDHTIQYLEEGVPGYRIINKCHQGRYIIEKEVITDPFRNCLLQHVKFIPLIGELKDYKVFILLAPHLANFGSGNTAWIGEYKGVQMLNAERADASLALSCSTGWKNASVGFVGVSDGWQDLNRNKNMTWKFLRAENGNVALTGEVDLLKTNGEITFSLGFGRKPTDAAQRSRASLLEGFEYTKESFIREWSEWQRSLTALKPVSEREYNLYRTSTAVLKTHNAKRIPGGLIASLSIPWGFAKGDDDIGGYHLVWPRDLCETAGGLIAARAYDDARKVLNYLMVTQESDGHWSQNMWLDGTTYWQGLQMDETAFPILLVNLARNKGVIKAKDIPSYWNMVKKAASFIMSHGPSTQQDRWEENSGYTPFTIAVEIAALLIAADIADEMKEHDNAKLLRETADSWNSEIENWLYATDTKISKAVGVEGYYMRIAPVDPSMESLPAYREIIIKNRNAEDSNKLAYEVISVDALALVRFGLRAADDPKMINTVKVIDHVIKGITNNGVCWYRYNYDGYGEHLDGSPYNGTGKGRLWPLLTGERAHYEIAAGNHKAAKELIQSFESFANEGGLFPEQVWDTEDIPSKHLYNGKPSGSAMPLVWAHAEYITLIRSFKERKVFDMPEQTYTRYVQNNTQPTIRIWTFNEQIKEISKGKKLRLMLLAPSRVRVSYDKWKTYTDLESIHTELGVHILDIETENLNTNTKIQFTFYWPEAFKWENTNFQVDII